MVPSTPIATVGKSIRVTPFMKFASGQMLTFAENGMVCTLIMHLDCAALPAGTISRFEKSPF